MRDSGWQPHENRLRDTWQNLALSYDTPQPEDVRTLSEALAGENSAPKEACVGPDVRRDDPVDDSFCGSRTTFERPMSEEPPNIDRDGISQPHTKGSLS